MKKTCINCQGEIDRLRQIISLERSIAHWKRMVAYVTAAIERNQSPEDVFRQAEERPIIDDCECCRRYYYDECDGCPIQETTDEMFCERTPYHEANKAWREYRLNDFVKHGTRMITFMQKIVNRLEAKS